MQLSFTFQGDYSGLYFTSVTKIKYCAYNAHLLCDLHRLNEFSWYSEVHRVHITSQFWQKGNSYYVQQCIASKTAYNAVLSYG